MNKKLNNGLIAERLKIARLKRGYRSCRQFAIKHHLSERNYQRHETGINSMDFSIMIQYCQALNISMLWLQTGDEKFLEVPFDIIDPVQV